MALSIENLDSLVQLPTGSGEQNMVHFAPSVFVLQYLEKSGQDDEGIRNKALRYMMQGKLECNTNFSHKLQIKLEKFTKLFAVNG